MSTGLNFGTGDASNQSPTYALQATHRYGMSFDVDPPMADSGLYTHTTADAGTGEINLLRLPPGRLKIFPDTSRLVTTQFEASADLHIGFRSYTEPDGDVIAEDDNALGDNIDAGGGAIDAALTLPAAGILELNSRDGVTIYALIDTADIENADTIRLLLHYKKAP